MTDRKTKAAALSIASNSTLITVKIIVGFVTGSVAILSEAVHSAVDLLASLIAYYSVKVSDLPADEDHPFGHGKIENISGTIEALLIFAAAGYIFYESIGRVFSPEPIRMAGLGLVLMALSVVVNILVSSRLFKVAREEDSIALEADAHHLRVDVWTSASVLLGLVVMIVLSPVIGKERAALLDPIIALAVAVQIVRISIKLTREAGAPLLDRRLPEDELAKLKEILLSDPRVVGYHKLRTRKAGSQRQIDVHLIVSENMTITEAHAVAEDVEDKIRAQFSPAVVITHVEPGTDDNLNIEDTTCREKDCGRNRRNKQTDA